MGNWWGSKIFRVIYQTYPEIKHEVKQIDNKKTNKESDSVSDSNGALFYVKKILLLKKIFDYERSYNSVIKFAIRDLKIIFNRFR